MFQHIEAIRKAFEVDHYLKFVAKRDTRGYIPGEILKHVKISKEMILEVLPWK